MTQPKANPDLNAALNAAKAFYPKGTIMVLFVLEEKKEGIAIDFVANTHTRKVAPVLRWWADGVLDGKIDVNFDPLGGVKQ